MEVRDKDKSLGYPSRDSTVPESRPRDEIILNQSQTLDHNPLPPYRLNNPQENTHHNPRINPDPVEGEETLLDRPNLKSPSLSPASTSTPPPPPRDTLIRYRECLKNHAAGMGGHVVDGCGEFMPSGEQGTPEALKCAACECHRNFHRKEIQGDQSSVNVNCTTPRNHSHPHPLYRFSHGPSTTIPIAPMMMAFGGAESSSEDLEMFRSNAGGGQTSSKKRFRTKFSQEQKEKMMEFADKLEWKIQKQDEQEVHQFCTQVGVKRQVFKVWMHNNKQAIKKKQL